VTERNEVGETMDQINASRPIGKGRQGKAPAWQFREPELERAASQSHVVGWRRPSRVRLEGNELVFDWPVLLPATAQAWTAAQVGPLPWGEWREQRQLLMTMENPQGKTGPGLTARLDRCEVYPTVEMLKGFAGLGDADDQTIRAFAAQYGALQEAFSEPAPSVLPARQTLDFWRGVSRDFAEALRVSRAVRTARASRDLAWTVNRHLLLAGVEEFLSFGKDGHPRLLRSSGGLYGGLAVELLLSVAGCGSRLCGGCGATLPKGGRRFCGDCRGNGTAAAIRQRRWREVHRSPDVIAG